MNTQNTSTPWTFVRALEDYFNLKFKYDMAASHENSKAADYFTEEDNSLSLGWPTDYPCFLNPPFVKVGKWAEKCYREKERGSRIISIWPLSSDLNMIDAWQVADVYPIHGRIWPLVRGCMVCDWSKNSGGLVRPLHWDRKASTLTRRL